ncbi:hypothetical protein WDU94_002567 [Cyamophila willieti]
MRCKQKSTGRWFAAKVMKATCPDFTEVSNLKEISILRKIPNHLNVLALVESYVNRTTCQVTLIFPLMELNLEEYIRTEGHVSEKRSKEILYQIINGLNHLHAHKVFHRDIKPENILLRADLVVIGDLGSLQFIKAKGLHTEYIATRWYRSPECLLTEGYYSYELDIWAAGCVFYETLTGFPLFPGDSEVDQLDRIHQVLGTPKPEVLKKFEKYKSSNFTYQFKQYLGTGINVSVPLNEKGKKLLYEMLKYDPKRRATAPKILTNPYFADLTALKQYIEQKQVMNKIAKKTCGMKISHPNHLLAKSSHRTDMSKFIQSDLNTTQQTKRTKSDFLTHQVPLMRQYRFDQSSTCLLHPKNRSRIEKRQKEAAEESRRKIQNEFQERKSKIKQKLNLLF